MTNARPNFSAYVILPRKYRPLMKAKSSPIGTPSARSRVATENVAFGESTCCARRPRQFAGDRRNMREITPLILSAPRSESVKAAWRGRSETARAFQTQDIQLPDEAVAASAL